MSLYCTASQHRHSLLYCPPTAPNRCTHYLRKAKLLLKKKRYFESLLDKTDGQLDNLEQLVGWTGSAGQGGVGWVGALRAAHRIAQVTLP